MSFLRIVEHTCKINWLNFSVSSSRTLAAKDFTPTYTSPSRIGTLERQKSLERRRSRTIDNDDEFDLMKEYRRIDEIYEKERDKRQKNLQMEEERRRHNYIPIKSPIPSDRYDSVYEDPFNFSPGRPRSASPGALAFGQHNRTRSTSAHSNYSEHELNGPCRALYSFTAQNSR